MVEIALLIFGGLVLLYLGAEGLLLGASSFAVRMRLSPLVIGLTVVGYGTSSPELFVTAESAFKGYGNLAIGNVIGSNIFTIGFILSLCTLIRPITLSKRLHQLDIPVLIFISLVLALFCIKGEITRIYGIFLILCLFVYTIHLFRVTRKSEIRKEEEFYEKEIGKKLKNSWLELFFIGGGIVFLLFGGQLFIKGAIRLATEWGISKGVMGLTLAAIGTSLPELCVSLLALYRKKMSIAVGNIIGSNIYNILFILGISALIRPIQITDITWVDLLMLLGTALAIYPFFQKDGRISRLHGALLMSAYLLYLIYL